MKFPINMESHKSHSKPPSSIVKTARALHPQLLQQLQDLSALFRGALLGEPHGEKRKEKPRENAWKIWKNVKNMWENHDFLEKKKRIWVANKIRC